MRASWDRCDVERTLRCCQSLAVRERRLLAAWEVGRVALQRLDCDCSICLPWLHTFVTNIFTVVVDVVFLAAVFCSEKR
jgi:hypothetical protein